MCTAKAPKQQAPTTDPKKPVVYMSNPWVDGLGINTAVGRNSLRTDGGVARRAIEFQPEPQKGVPPLLANPINPGGAPGVSTPGIVRRPNAGLGIFVRER